MLSSELYSHPGKTLEIHLLNVAQIAVNNLAEKSITLINSDLFKNVVNLTALSHDLGKSTAFFQEYLFASAGTDGRKKGGEETKHGLLSAVACYYVVKEFISTYAEESEEGALLPFLAFLAVKRHHGDLEDVIDETIVTDEKLEILQKQVDRIDSTKFEVLVEYLTKAGLPLHLNKDMLYQWILNINNELSTFRRRYLRKLSKSNNMNLYLLCNMLFSLLIDADKSEVTVGTDFTRQWYDISSHIVDAYKASKSFNNTAINKLREQAYKEVLEHRINLNQRLYSINLPTGLGKTYASLAFALKLRSLLYNQNGIKMRIIYALPFLSIIEQNASEIEKILKHSSITTDTNIILKHHHLSEIYYKNDEQEYDTDEAKILIEGWNSEIIITTFVQLFHTMASNKNRMLKKFHRLANSIILLDEVQSIPPQYWALIQELIYFITHNMNSYVVLVTATEPLIFDKSRICYLVDRDRYFKLLDRVTIYVRLDKSLSLEEFTDTLSFEPDKSYLFIMNTISAARKLYELLSQRISGEDIAFLSSRVVPCQRLERIEKIRNKENRIAVTTQLVEAGVDIDFDVVYRDLAPLDSINQAAGRCNRNGLKSGTMVVVSLIDEKKTFASYIYDNVLLAATHDLLSAYKEIHEYDFLKLIEEYYQLVTQRISRDRSRELCSAIYALKYQSEDQTLSIADFKLINNDYPQLEVFVETSKEAEEIWRRYCELKEIPNIIERRKVFDTIKKDFYTNVISIPQNSKNIPPLIHGFGYVGKNVLNSYYDQKTGYKSEGETEIW